MAESNEHSITLRLTRREAAVLLGVMNSIGGDRRESYRKETNAVADALANALGVDGRDVHTVPDEPLLDPPVSEQMSRGESVIHFKKNS